MFDEQKTKELRDYLPKNITGIALKRKFPKDENETHYAGYIYSIWRYCDEKEIEGEIDYKLNLTFDPLFMDWLQNEKNISRTESIKISSTPIFLLGNINEESTSGISVLAIIFIVIGSILLILILGIVGLYCYKRFVKKKDIPLNKNILSSLLH